MEAAEEGYEYLIRNGPITANNGDTTVCLAAENSHTNITRTLIQSGPALELKSEGGKTRGPS